MKLRSIDIIVYLLYLAFLALGVVAGSRDALWYVALCLSAVCAVLWFIARWQLGEAFSVAPEARQLRPLGSVLEAPPPHLRLRNTGVPLRRPCSARLAGTDHLAGGDTDQVGRARREEAVLLETFGAEYSAYRSRTWF